MGKRKRKLSVVVSTYNPSDGEAGGGDSRSLGTCPPPSLVHVVRIQVNERARQKTKSGRYLRINTPGCLSPSRPINRLHAYPYQCKCRHIHGTLNNTETDRHGRLKVQKAHKTWRLKAPWAPALVLLCHVPRSHRLSLLESVPSLSERGSVSAEKAQQCLVYSTESWICATSYKQSHV